MDKPNISRLTILQIGFAFASLLIVLNIIRIQSNAIAIDMSKAAHSQYEQIRQLVTPERGNIYDKWGHLLAGSREVYEVGVEFNQLYNSATVAHDLSQILGIDETKLVGLLANPNQLNYAQIARDVEPDKVQQISQLREGYKTLKVHLKSGQLIPSLRGVTWTPYLIRSYPENTLSSGILGIVRFHEGLNPPAVLGVEEKYNDLLAGKALYVETNIDPKSVQAAQEIPPGDSLQLTIDRDIQAMAEKQINHAVEKNGAASGTIIIMDPRTGEIMAMASTPQLNLNEYWKYLEQFPKDTSINRAISQTYEPGSVFKVLTMAAAINEGIVKPNTPFLDTGSIEVGGLTIYNWDRAAYGPQDMIGCMQHSLNVCLAWVATQLGREKFLDYVDRFNIGRRTNIDMAGEVYYPVNMPGDKYWSESNLGTYAFGQGLAVTPIQLATAISAVANDGKMMAPHVVKAIIHNGKVTPVEPHVLAQPITKQTANTLSEMLAVSLVNEASTALVPGYRVSGKTGTAEIAIPGEGYVTNLTNASFVGWGPTDDPRFLVYLWLEKPTSAPWSSVIVAPIFSSVVTDLVTLMDLPPDSVRQHLYGQ